MITNRRVKHFITLFLSPFLISGLLLHPAIITFSHAAPTITSDGTMGTTINQAGNIYNINGGTIKGTNQFHSFGLFSVVTGGTASFNGPPVISNIIGRVTGGQQSIIDGILRSTITGANLYLLNPYGVLFGPNASLNVSGSFHVSTADYLRLSDGGIYYSNPLSSSVLTTASPVAFGFLSNNPAAISIQDSYLEVPEGKTLSIIGGDINITGGPTGWLWAPSGRINIASVASPGEVIPVESRNAPDLQMSSFDRLGRIDLLNWAYLDVSSSSGSGTVMIRGGKLFVEDSYVVANTTGNIDGAKKGIDIGISGSMEMENSLIEAVTTGNGQGGDIVIRSGSLEMKNSSGIMALTEGWGNSGNVEVNTGSLDMREGSQIMNNVDFFSDGNAGNLTVTADSILMTGAYDPSGRTTGVASATGFGSTGRGGDLRVTTGSLEIRDGATFFTSTYGSGAGGNVDINAESILVSGKNAKGLSATIAAWSNSDGNAGGIRINTGNLEVRNGYISTSAGSSGRPGDLDVTADRILFTEGGGIFAGGTAADSGNIRIKTGSFEMTDGAVMTSDTYTSWAGGDIDVTATNSILLSGENTGISSSSVFGTGTGGTIRLNAQNLEVKEGASISATTFGPGDGGKIEANAESVRISGFLFSTTLSSGKAGDIQITAKNILEVNGGVFDATTRGSGGGGNISLAAPRITGANGGDIAAATLGTGTGGNIQLSGNQIQLINGGSIVAGTVGSGTGGSIQLSGNQIQLINGGSIWAGTGGSGAGGSIQLSGNQIQLINGASISAKSVGTGNAGDISINAGGTLLMKNSSITTEATQADGGNIHIHAGYMVNLIDSKITASVGGGPQTTGGNITIDPQFVILNDSQIIANAYEGKGGNIRIVADVFLASPESIVDASSTLGIDGTVDIQAPITSIVGTLAPMQGNFLSAEALLRDHCAARIRGESISSFVVSGRDGLPIRPGSVLPSPIY